MTLTLRKMSAVTLLGTLLAAGVATVAPAPASATGTYTITQNQVNVRTGPSTSYGATTQYNSGQSVYINCQVHGQRVTWGNYASDVWDHTSAGFFSDLFVNTPTYGAFSPGMADCNATAPTPAPSSGRATGLKMPSNTGYSGQCTWGALEQWKARAGYYLRVSGNAKDWAASARANGWTVVADAQSQSIVVFQPGVQGANRTYGHVGYVTSTSRHSDGLYITFTEMNGTAGPGRYDQRTVKDIAGMSYILKP
jgi:surface antigen